jgi:chorismate mutase/prephenate dehydratase
MGYEEQISVLRERVSEVDSQMVELFEKRMKVVDEIAVLKKQYGKDVLDAKREDDVIERAVSKLKDKNLSEATSEFFAAIMDISRKTQRQAMQFEKPSSIKFSEVKDAKVAYLGIKGSYSYIAAEQSFDKSAKLMNYPSFEAILEALKDDEVDYALLPAENTHTGSVTPAIDALARYGYYIVGEKLQPISHNMLGVKGSQLGDIKKVYSHPQAISQCSEFLGDKFEAYPSLSSAHAAKSVAEQGDRSIGAIGSVSSGEIYDLDILKREIQNEDTNCTRFVIVSKRPYKGNSCDKTSIVILLMHKPRSLYEMLSVFSNVNILKLESRPIKDRQFEYQFHIDFEGNIYEKDISEMIERVKKKAAGYTYLGCYPSERSL